MRNEQETQVGIFCLRTESRIEGSILQQIIKRIMLKFVTSIFFFPQLARLSSEDMKIVNNMRLLAGSLNSKKPSTDFSLKFDGQKVKKLKLFKWMLKTRVRYSLHKLLYQSMVIVDIFWVMITRQSKLQEKSGLVRKKHGHCLNFIPS